MKRGELTENLVPQVTTRGFVRLIRFGTETLIIETPAKDNIRIEAFFKNLVSQLLQVDVDVIFCTC